jgi:hypothetical protein
MGALIATRGTRRLAKLYNNRFDKGSISATRRTILEDAVLTALFSTPTTTSLPIYEITNHDQATFLPPPSSNHPNLLKRWDYYLHREFQQSNQELLRRYISDVLNLQSGINGPLGTNANGDTYVAIHFDCVEAAPGQSQIVVQSDEYKLKNNDSDDTGMLKNSAYSLIVLITDPVKNAPDPIDNQNYQ